MKILFIVQKFHPSVGGMQELVYQLSKNLILIGHDITIATEFIKNRNRQLINGIKIVDFKIAGNYVRGYEGEITEINRYKNYVLESNFDIIVLFAAQIWSTDIILQILPKIKGKKVFVPTGFSSLFNIKFEQYYNILADNLKYFSHIICHSMYYRDFTFIVKYNYQNISIIDNGAAYDEFVATNNNKFLNEKDYLNFCTIGNHTGEKGHSETIKIFSKINLNKSTLFIVGGNSEKINFQLIFKYFVKKLFRIPSFLPCSSFCKLKVLVFNYNPKRLFDKKKIFSLSGNRNETIDLLKKSGFFLFFSNIECAPIVLYEAIAAGCIIVSHDVGNVKNVVLENKAGLIANTNFDKFQYSHVDIADAVKKINELIKFDVIAKRKITYDNHDSWLKKYTWEEITNKYLKIFEAIYERR